MPGGLGHFRRELGNGRGQCRVGSAASGDAREGAGPARWGAVPSPAAPQAGTAATVFSHSVSFEQELVSCPVLNIISPLVPHRQLWPRRKLDQTTGKRTITLPLNYSLNSVMTPTTRMLRHTSSL